MYVFYSRLQGIIPFPIRMNPYFYCNIYERDQSPQSLIYFITLHNVCFYTNTKTMHGEEVSRTKNKIIVCRTRTEEKTMDQNAHMHAQHTAYQHHIRIYIVGPITARTFLRSFFHTPPPSPLVEFMRDSACSDVPAAAILPLFPSSFLVAPLFREANRIFYQIISIKKHFAELCVCVCFSFLVVVHI